MYSLYVDSTSGLVIGLLDSAFNWIEYLDTTSIKPSEVIHYEIFNLIKRHDLELKDMNFFFSAGPGSYTGMRLGEGIAQVLAWDSKKVFSFHHFDVPKLIGVQEGFWATNAFKGQVFVYKWNTENGQSEKELIDTANFKIVDAELGYTLSTEIKEFAHLKTTKDLIKNSSSLIFSKAFKEKLRSPPYYFRTLEEEFKNA